MNIKEERKAFEAWYKKSYGINIDLPVMPNAQYPELRKQFSWDSWQASVNREGFVLVPKEPTEEMCKQLSGNTDNAKLIYKAMLSAKEQSNESN